MNILYKNDSGLIYEKMPLLRPQLLNKSQKLCDCFSKRRIWKLEEDWLFTYKGDTFIINAGFLFDGASIPSCFNCWRSPTGILFISALIHDWGYQNAYFLKVIDKNKEATNDTLKTKSKIQRTSKMHKSRNEIDVIFREISKDNVFFAYITYIILYLFGWIAWNQYRKNDNNAKKLKITLKSKITQE